MKSHFFAIFALLLILAASAQAYPALRTKRSLSSYDDDEDEDDNTLFIQGPSSEIETDSGAEVLQMLVNKEEADIPYTIIFHSGSTSGPAKKKLREYESAVQSQFLAGHSEIRYMKIDCSKRNYEDLISAIGINTNELEESPSVLVMKGGKGRWVHGPNTIEQIAEFGRTLIQK